MTPPPPMAIKVHTGRFIRMTPPPPMAIKVHTGRFIRKMSFDMKDVTWANSGTCTTPPSPRGYQSTHRQIYNEDDI